MMADPGICARMTYKQVREHIEKQSPLPVVLVLLEEMYEMYKGALADGAGRGKFNGGRRQAAGVE